MTGPEGSSAEVPRASLQFGARGTPKRMTDLRPLAMSGVRKGTILLTPRRCWLGKDGMRVSSSGLSVMKRG